MTEKLSTEDSKFEKIPETKHDVTELRPQSAGKPAVMMFTGRVKMDYYPGSAHTREAVIYINKKFAVRPTINLTVYSERNPGTMFVIYNVTATKMLDDTLQVGIAASNVNIGQQVPDLVFFADFTIIGEVSN